MTKKKEEEFLRYLAQEDDDPVFRFSDEFELQRVVGEGAFGLVISARDKYTGETSALKIINKEMIEKSRVEQLRTESKILADLYHPNIVKFHQVRENKKYIFMKMEYVHGTNLGTFFQQCKKEDKNIPDELIKDILCRILSAVEYLHSQKIIHRDLKPENIIVKIVKDSLLTLKIIDFGLSVKNIWTTRSSGLIGTPLYFAPEIVFEKDYNNSVDLWSCGIIFFMCFSRGIHPLYASSSHTKEDYFKILKSKITINLFLRLAATRPEDRFTATQALSHPWLTGKSMETMPMTAQEQIIVFANEQKLLKAISALMFIHHVRGFNLIEYGLQLDETSPRKAYQKTLLHSTFRDFKIRKGAVGMKNSVVQTKKQPVSNETESTGQLYLNKERSISLTEKLQASAKMVPEDTLKPYSSPGRKIRIKAKNASADRPLDFIKTLRNNNSVKSLHNTPNESIEIQKKGASASRQDSLSHHGSDENNASSEPCSILEGNPDVFSRKIKIKNSSSLRSSVTIGSMNKSSVRGISPVMGAGASPVFKLGASPAIAKSPSHLPVINTTSPSKVKKVGDSIGGTLPDENKSLKSLVISTNPKKFFSPGIKKH